MGQRAAVDGRHAGLQLRDGSAPVAAVRIGICARFSNALPVVLAQSAHAAGDGWGGEAVFAVDTCTLCIWEYVQPMRRLQVMQRKMKSQEQRLLKLEQAVACLSSGTAQCNSSAAPE